MSSMHGKYADRRVYQHFVHTYSRVPYLDHEIFNLSVRSNGLARQAEGRASSARQGLSRIMEISDKLEKSLKDSRNRRDQENAEFTKELQTSQKSGQERSKLTWSRVQEEKQLNRSEYKKDKEYLDELLKTNATRAQSRRKSYRRWT